ncbi:MAG: T9SS type A sorting domain-containing protein [Bacteroidia bacterium]
MKKTALLFLSALMLGAIQVDAQNPVLNQVLIGNGGNFGAPGNQVEFGRYNPADQSYFTFAAVPGSYTNFAYVDSQEVYMNADSFVFRYELDHYQQLGVFQSVGVVDMARYEDYLIVLKGFGAQGDYVDILDTGTFVPAGSIPQITNEARDIAIVGDTAYITHNLPGTIDQFPPFQIFADSIGYIAIIDLPNRKFVRNISLGQNGAGAGQIFIQNNTLFTVNNEAGSIGRYLLGTNVSTTTNLPVADKGAGIKDGLLYANFGQGIGSFDISTLAIIDTNIVERPGIEAMTMDTLANEFYATYTDFFSYGSLGRYDINGNLIDSLEIGVSPQAIATEYRTKPIAEFMASETAPLVYDTVMFIDLSIHDPVHYQWSITPSSFVYVKSTGQNSQNPFIVFTDTGKFTIQLIVSSAGAADTLEREQYIRVVAEPLNLNFSATDRNPDTSDTVTFTPTYTFAPDSFRWIITPAAFQYVNGTDSLSEIIDVVFDKGGFFTVTLVAYSPFDKDSIEKFRYIEVEGPTGVAGYSDFDFNIYPNPTSNILNIEISGKIPSEVNVTLYAADGRNLLDHQFAGTEARLDISHLKKGVYFLEINSETERTIKKVIKF